MKQKPLRDRKYLDYLRTQRCIITGYKGEGVIAHHVTRAGMSMKAGDDCCLPMKDYEHKILHGMSEAQYWRGNAPDDVIMKAMRAYARELYTQWEKENG